MLPYARHVTINFRVAISRKYGEWNVYQYTIQFRPDISSDIRQNPVPAGFQQMPSGASLLSPDETRSVEMIWDEMSDKNSPLINRLMHKVAKKVT